MDNKPTYWIISTLRWMAWFIVCLGIAAELFVLRGAGLAIVNRVVAEQVIQRQDAGQIVNIKLIDGFINTGQIVFGLIVSAIAVGLSVVLDYYLRAGQKNGTLFRRIGLALAIELTVYGLAILVQIFV